MRKTRSLSCYLLFHPLLIGIIFLSTIPFQAFAQNFNFIQYGLREGLPQSQVQDVIQDDFGFLWIATQGGGIARFDGAQFKVYATSEGLPSNFINCLASAPNGNIWIGTSKGLALLEENTIQTEIIEDPSAIHQLTFFNDSLLAIGTANGLQFLNVNQRKIVPSKFSSVRINQIQRLANGQLSVATDKGWWLIRSLQDFEVVTQDQGLLNNEVIATVQKSRNSIWVISKEQGMTLHRINYPNQIIDRKTLPSANISTALSIGSNTIWFGTSDQGIYIYQNGLSTQIDRRNGLPNNSIKKILKDRLGQIWMASKGGGLIKVLEQNFQFFDKSDGLPANSIKAIAQDTSTKQLWLAMAEQGLAFMEDGQIYPYRFDKDFLNVPTTALCFDQQNRLWAGTNGKGIGLFDSLGLYQILDVNRGLGGNRITSLNCDNNGRIWVGTRDNGLNRITISLVDSLEKIAIQPRGETANQQITTIQKDLQGNIWFANRQGQLARVMQDQSIVFYDHHQGIPRSAIQTMKFDTKGGLWLGLAGEGLVYAQSTKGKPKFNKHPITPKLSSSNIYLIEIDAQGDLWIGHQKGVDRFSPKDADKSTVTFYGYTQGFLGGETNTNAATIDQQGNIWIGTVGGLVRVQADAKTERSEAPILSFASIKIQNQLIQQSKYAPFYIPKNGIKEGLLLPWNINQLEFQLNGIHLNYPQSIKYSWRLKGLSDIWNEWNKSNLVTFSNLAPGNYEFEARATCDEQVISEIIKSPFSINTPIWKRAWFLWVAGIGLTFLLSILFYWRIQQIRKKESRKRRNLEMENQLLNLNQKALQLQMNPHFIFNTLNSINALVAKGKNAEARKQINNFAKQLRSTLSNSRKEYISLEEEVKSLREYLVMLQFCHSIPFKFTIQLRDNINSEELELPPMIIQPFVENAVLHGFSQLDRQGQLQIAFSLQGKLLHCEITDNGIGRKAAGQSKAQKKGGHQSAGMEVTKARLDNLKDRLTYKSLEIIDLEEDGVATGTKVIVRIPFRVSY